MDQVRSEAASGLLTNVVYRDGGELKKTRKVTGDINAKATSSYGEMTGKVRLHVLLESSGCPWGQCHFCVHHHLEPEYLRRKVEKIVEEIRLMREQGIGLFRFAGSDTPPEFGAAIARGILSAGLKLEFAMGSRARKGAKEPAVFAELVENYTLMIRAGLRAVFIGGETGNDTINEQVMNKGLGFDDLVWTIRALRAAEKRAGHHVDISLAMIYPTPLVAGVTDEQVKSDNLRLIAEARPDSVMVTPPGPFKHSEWFKRRTAFGFAFEDTLIPQAMEYEYVLYKPLELWPKLEYRLGKRNFVDILRACGTMRAAVEELGVPTDLSDEHFLTMRACGYEGAEGARAFKKEALADIVSCDYSRLDALCAMANEYSVRLAGRAERRESAAPLPRLPGLVNEGPMVPAPLGIQAV